MKKELTDLAASVLASARAAGANAAAVSLSTERSVQISYRERKPETIKESSTRDLTLDLYVNGRYSSQGTSDLRAASLKAFVADAVAMTKLLAEDPFRALPDPKYYAGRASVDLGLVDPAQAALSPAERHDAAKAVEAACLARGGDKVISVSAGANDTRSEQLLMTTNGFEGTSEGTYFTLGASMTAQDAGDRRPQGYAYFTAVRRGDLPKAEEIGREAAERSLAMLGAKKVKTETLPIIIENRTVARLLYNLLGPMTARSVQQKQSFLADKKGKPIASAALTVIDDPLLAHGLGSQLFDGEGLAARRRTMIETGVLKEFFVDTYYGRKLGWEPTTARPSNLVVVPGKRSLAEIMKELGRGVLVTGFIGGNSNSTTGDFSVGIFGRLFENGAFSQPLAEMNIAGSSLDFWSKLIEVGNDPWTYSSIRTPSLAFRDVVVAGV